VFCACLCERAPSEVGGQAVEVFSVTVTAVPWKMGAPSELAACCLMASVAVWKLVVGLCVVSLELVAPSILVGFLGLEALVAGAASVQGQRDAATLQFLEWHFGCCLQILGKAVGQHSVGDRSGPGCHQQIVADSRRWLFLGKEWNVGKTKGCRHRVHGKCWVLGI
jgi:hypothetical protein